MRFAPPPAVRVSNTASGMNQVLARTLNERLITSLLLQNDGMTRLQLGQESGLSAQTISVIVRALEADNLILKGEAVRGRVGPPTTPIILNPKGAFSLGVNVAANELSGAIVNFVGQVVETVRVPLESQEVLTSSLTMLVDELLGACSPQMRKLVAGIGVTLPDDFDSIHGSKIEFETLLEGHTGIETFIQNDVTALASAETLFGATRKSGDFLYCYVDACLHPRLCLSGRIHSGQTPPPFHTTSPGRDSEVDEAWIDAASFAVRNMISTTSLLAKIPTVVLASHAPSQHLQALIDSIAMPKDQDVEVVPSYFGQDALAAGAAALPLHPKFMSRSDAAT
ncbi:ROK family transcriptional regulator [Tateyamaria omphalii]|uniref:ROK family transcriptional regulator n=1 Tax=Tateyamaria omphalii TaxID=299262 RepID=UPI001C99E56A|nr:ROK family transcriptional regulator [Tateyamaria omphalii]MBY5934935.1 ROK family transcriptional regulator [Tateyamaria omphalii]